MIARIATSIVITGLTMNGYVAAQAVWPQDAIQSAQRVAACFARRALGSADVTVRYEETYVTLEGDPHAHVFLCSCGDARLTCAVGPDRKQFPILFYYFDTPLHHRMRALLDQPESSELVVSDAGVFLCTNSGFRQWPALRAVTRQEIDSMVLQHRRGQIGAVADQKQLRERLSRAWTWVDAALSGLKGDTKDAVEVIIPGVPNYLWYMNCLLTAETMILGFWNDHGCESFVPGGTSTDGFYWAITEELCWIEFGPGRIPHYTVAPEFGNDVPFTASNHLGKEWEVYKNTIDTYQTPLSASWQGAPYGAHATVGVGYKEDAGQRFLILHDTWVNRPAYVNYDAYYETFGGFYRHYPAGRKSRRSTPPPFKNGISLDPVAVQFVPALNTQRYAYHCMEPADIDGDGALDLLVCNFSLVRTNALMLYMKEGDHYVRDTDFVPPFGKYDCPHVARAADFDADGDTDVGVTGYWSSVWVFVNDGGVLSNAALQVDNEGRGFTDLAWGDYDGDGDLDVASSTLRATIRLYRNDESTFVRVTEIGSGGQYTHLEFCDLSEDGYPELLASDRTGSVVAFANDSGAFTGSLYFSSTGGRGAMGFDSADLDGDGFREIVTVDEGRIAIFENQGGTLSPDPSYLDTQAECFARDLVLDDLTGDGLPELIVGNYSRPNVIFKNAGGRFESAPWWTAPQVEPTVRVHVFDREGNGIKNVLFLKARGGTVDFFQVTPPPETPFKRCDCNADGRADLTDAAVILLFLFTDLLDPSCVEALDANDNGKVEIADAIWLLSYLYAGGEVPPEPFQSCGIDPTADTLGCESFSACTER